MKSRDPWLVLTKEQKVAISLRLLELADENEFGIVEMGQIRRQIGKDAREGFAEVIETFINSGMAKNYAGDSFKIRSKGVYKS